MQNNSDDSEQEDETVNNPLYRITPDRYTPLRLTARLAAIAGFVCLCKIWNNMARKIEHPFLLSKEWMIILTLCLLIAAIKAIVERVQKIQKNWTSIKESPIKSTLKHSLLIIIAMASTLVPAIMIILYLTKVINQKLIEKTIQIFTWFNVASLLLIPCLIVLTILLVCMLICIGKCLPERYLTRLVSALEEFVDASESVGVAPVVGETLGRYIKDNTPIRLQKVEFKGILEHSGDLDYKTTSGKKTQILTVEKLTALFEAMKNRSVHKDFKSTTDYFTKLKGRTPETKNAFLDCVLETLEGPATQADGRTENNNEVSEVFNNFLSNNRLVSTETNEQVKIRIKATILGLSVEAVQNLDASAQNDIAGNRTGQSETTHGRERAELHRTALLPNSNLTEHNNQPDDELLRLLGD